MSASDAKESNESFLPEMPLDSPFENIKNDLGSALDEFRDNWQRELRTQSVNANNAADAWRDGNADSVEAENADQDLAVNLFRKAVEYEQRGRVYDALPFYRKAIQIDPNIEFKFYEDQKSKVNTNDESSGIVDKTTTGDNKIVDDDDDATTDVFESLNLYEKFQKDVLTEYGGKLLLSNSDAGVLTTELHISDLPTEIIHMIFRWVVSMQLDMRSLEQCAAVSKGFFLCARDEDIWRLACLKVWGANTGTPSNPITSSDGIIDIQCPVYLSWRQMFIERERVLFNGCYISKSKYLRMGENSFQDIYYRPVQLVEYYRYIRFIPDGTVLMMTTAEEPAVGVSKLKNPYQPRSDILRGQYRLTGNVITIIFSKLQNINKFQQYGRQRRGSNVMAETVNKTKYYIEFRILGTTKRKFVQLAWQYYSLKTVRNKIESETEFDLLPSKYPPFWFSPVRSYHSDAEAPLN